MKHPCKFFLIILFLLIVGLFLANANYIKQDTNHSTTLTETINIASSSAQKWAQDAKLIQVISTDAGDDSKDIRGINGKRKCWNTFFSSPSKNKQYNIFITDGEVSYTNEIQFPLDQIIDINNSFIDSDDAALIAQNNGIEPTLSDEGWAIGYHYSLQYIFNSTSSSTLALLVYGQLDGHFSYIVINPLNAEVISILQQQGYDQNGRAIWDEVEK